MIQIVQRSENFILIHVGSYKRILLNKIQHTKTIEC